MTDHDAAIIVWAVALAISGCFSLAGIAIFYGERKSRRIPK